MLKCVVELQVLTKVVRLLLDGAAWANKRDHLSMPVPKAAPQNVNSSNWSSWSSMLCFPEVTQSAGSQFLVPQSLPFGSLPTSSYRVHRRCVTGWGRGLCLHRRHQVFLSSATLCGVMEGMLSSSQTPIILHCYWLLPGIVLLRQGLIFELDWPRVHCLDLASFQLLAIYLHLSPKNYIF